MQQAIEIPVESSGMKEHTCKNEDRLLAALHDGPKSREQLSALLGIGNTTVLDHLRPLMNDRLVKRFDAFNPGQKRGRTKAMFALINDASPEPEWQWEWVCKEFVLRLQEHGGTVVRRGMRAVLDLDDIDAWVMNEVVKHLQRRGVVWIDNVNYKDYRYHDVVKLITRA